MEKPAEMFDRDSEWTALGAFVNSSRPSATLGVVSGRRRQGKSFLLAALCRATGGFYFSAEEAVEAESLRYLGDSLARFTNSPGPIHLPDWRIAMEALLSLGKDRQRPVVLDEFPYLVKASSSLPSVIQAAFAPFQEMSTSSRTRLLLCGSAMSFMGSLLAGTAPLRGRAGLELVVQTLDYRLAREFWGIEDLRLATQVNAIVGGTPAYRREYVEDDTPKGPEDFDAWVVRAVLNPYRPLFREARYLLAEEPDIRDTGLYHSVLAAVADGNNTRGKIANYLGRKAGDITHHLAVLEDAGLLLREPDLLHGKRTSYRIAEPLITFYHGVMRPIWSEIERTRDLERVWQRSKQRFLSNAVGPRFEQICRTWAMDYAGADHFGDYASQVGSGTVNDPENRMTHEIDVVAIGDADRGRKPLLSIGEVKWNEVMDMRHLDRLRRIRSLLDMHHEFDNSRTRLVCYGGAGFTAGLRAAEERGEVVLIGLSELYSRQR